MTLILAFIAIEFSSVRITEPRLRQHFYLLYVYIKNEVTSWYTCFTYSLFSDTHTYVSDTPSIKVFSLWFHELLISFDYYLCSSHILLNDIGRIPNETV
jgi:hypothetical protein